MKKTARQIDITIHELTAAQALEALLRLFRESKTSPVSIFVRRGDGKTFVAKIRTELTRMRRTYEEQGRFVPHFGFTVEGPFYIHSDGIAKEGLVIHFRLTRLQYVKNLAQTMEFVS